MISLQKILVKENTLKVLSVNSYHEINGMTLFAMFICIYLFADPYFQYFDVSK